MYNFFVILLTILLLHSVAFSDECVEKMAEQLKKNTDLTSEQASVVAESICLKRQLPSLKHQPDQPSSKDTDNQFNAKSPPSTWQVEGYSYKRNHNNTQQRNKDKDKNRNSNNNSIFSGNQGIWGLQSPHNQPGSSSGQSSGGHSSGGSSSGGGSGGSGGGGGGG